MCPRRTKFLCTTFCFVPQLNSRILFYKDTLPIYHFAALATSEALVKMTYWFYCPSYKWLLNQVEETHFDQIYMRFWKNTSWYYSDLDINSLQ